ncbi:MAG: NADP-dependent malic enzyme [Burkholderiales bacterium]|jgi:malate dehydrogenase (oxaloacetate-decarboxylating)(NADP+)|nr:NADP-dependent malic enzyme [Burkholderiales bacterium]
MMSDDNIRQASLDYHRKRPAGKIEVQPTKSLVTQRDLALAYTPGVAAACDEIVARPDEARQLTARGNLIAVITNGTAVLGLGNIGPLAAKPVMEGKAVLFKKFAGIDCFDLEIDEPDPQRMTDMVCALEPTFGGINLEDIKAPECFYIEEHCRQRMKIPVFHDDQHGTAIIVGAALTNGLRIVGKKIEDIKIVCSGAGAAALSCLKLLVLLGAKRENIWVSDIHGVVYEGRETEMDEYKAQFAQKTDKRTLAEILPGADVFLGLSVGRVLKQAWLPSMADKPLVFVLANPEPEIRPEQVKEVRPDAVIATGRSDYPNQVNNVLCFPFIFRGALDVGATQINDAMKVACVRAIADLAMDEQSEIVEAAYNTNDLRFGADYLIPKPFDPRLILKIAPAVAKAAMDSGVATQPIEDFEAYHQQLRQFVYHSGFLMKPVFDAAKAAPKRIVLAEGEDVRMLRAVQILRDEKIADLTLIGRAHVIEQRIARLGLRLKPGRDFEIINPEQYDLYREYCAEYYALTQRKGVSSDYAKLEARRRPTLIGAMAVRRGEAAGMVCGLVTTYALNLHYIDQIIGRRPGVKCYAAMNGVMLPGQTLFITDTYINPDPTPEQLAEITLMAAREVRRFGLEPKVALLSHSSFGTSNLPSARKMRDTLPLIQALDPSLEVEGEVQGDSALSETVRAAVFPEAKLSGSANLLVMPSLDAANIAFNLLKITGSNNVTIGPILLGVNAPIHILTPSATVRRIVNMTALAVAEATLGESGAEKTAR